MKEIRLSKGLKSTLIGDRTGIYLESDGKFMVKFYYDGRPDYDLKGTFGLATKAYVTEEKALRAAKHYINM